MSWILCCNYKRHWRFYGLSYRYVHVKTTKEAVEQSAEFLGPPLYHTLSYIGTWSRYAPTSNYNKAPRTLYGRLSERNENFRFFFCRFDCCVDMEDKHGFVLRRDSRHRLRYSPASSAQRSATDERILHTPFNPLECKGNYSATSNSVKLVQWPLLGGLLHLVHPGDWAEPQPAQALPRYTKCNSQPINGQCTNHRTAVMIRCSAVCGFNVLMKGLAIYFRN